MADEKASVTPTGRLARPSVAAILESQPVPAFFIGGEGRIIVPNRAAQRFVTTSAKGSGVFAHDGTDLWTILWGRSDEADPFFDIRIRLREAGGEVTDAAMTVVPMRGPGGVLSGAMVFLLSIPGDRLHPREEDVNENRRMQGIVERLGKLVGADLAYVVEFDSEVTPEGRLRAFWSADGAGPASEQFTMRGSPSAAYQGRRILSIPSGLSEAYPNGRLIAGFESYVGAALFGESGEQIGCLAAVWREPLRDAAGMHAVLAITSVEASRALRYDMARREFLESEQRYGALFEGSAVPMLLIEPITTQIVDANPAACQFYGYPYNELLLMSVLQVDALSSEALQAELERAAKGARGRFVAQHILSGGRLRDVEVSIGPITVTGKRLLYCMVSDITDRRRIEAELDRSRRNLEQAVGQRTQDLLRANAELQQASMSRDLVIGSMAQEVRSCVGTITGQARHLLDESDAMTDEQRGQLETVRREGERLESFLATIEAQHRQHGEHARAEEEFDLVSLVESVSLGLASFAEDKGLRLRFVADARPLDVVTDRYKVQQVLLNLLSNAIRYTAQGGVTITVKADGGYLDVQVADTGAGIEKGRLETLFDEPEVNQDTVGIGLPASQRIAALLGGTIQVSSTPGKGSTFTLRLPKGEECSGE